MTIIRTPRPTHYTVINNAVFNDDKPLSWDAMGLLCYLLSKPDNWQVSPSALANTQRCGINKIHNLLKELKQAGFLVGKKNRSGTFDYYVFDSKQDETPDLKPNHEKPNQEKPNQEKPNQDLETQINTEYKTNTDTEINTDSLANAREGKTRKKQKTEKSHFQKPTAEDIFAYCGDELKTAFDAYKFIDYYDANGWMVGKQKMKDWKATVRNWIRRDQERQAQKNPLEGNQAGSLQATHHTNKVIHYANYSRTGTERKLSLAEQAEAGTRRLIEREEREARERCRESCIVG